MIILFEVEWTQLSVSKEVAFYGLVLVGSGFSQLIENLMVPGFLKLFSGCVLSLLGAFLFIVGLFWRWHGEYERPLGVTLLSISYGLIGMIAIFLGGWFLTIVFLLALMCFVIAWSLLKGKTWGRLLVFVSASVQLLVASIGILGDLMYLGGILSSIYVLWYLNRPQVVKFFKAESLAEVTISRKTLCFLLLVILAFVVYLANAYAYPPMRILVSEKFQGWGTGPGGGSGRYFYAGQRDLVAFDFKVDPDSAPVNFYIESSGYPSVRIAASQGFSGSGSVEVPFSDQWMMWVISQGTYMSVQVEISALQFSTRMPTLRWLQMNLVFVALLLAWILTSKNRVLSLYV